MMSKTVAELLAGVLEQFGVMKRTGSKDRTSTEPTMSARMGAGSWIILIVLLSLLVATGVVIYFGWTLANGTDVPTSGYAAMVFGVIISLAVGFGLMALVFYSSRKGYDEPPVLIAPEDDLQDSKDVPEASNIGKAIPYEWPD
jgi:flagellar basal body-associated protein FliL